MSRTYEVNQRKNITNLDKHGISLLESKHVFDDKNKVIRRSDRNGETRWQVIGKYLSKIWAVAFCKRHPNTRLISAREASPDELALYNKLNKNK